MSLAKLLFRRNAFAIVLTAASVAVPAEAAFIPISTCDITSTPPAGSLISAPGDYEVVKNLTLGPVTECILITTSGVSLKLNGFQITGVNNGLAGIEVSNAPKRVDHVSIEGPGLIRGFQNGVLIFNADYSQVDLVTATNNTLNGIGAAGSTFMTIASNVLDENGRWGALLANSVSSSVQGNETSGNGGLTPATGLGGGIGLVGGSAANAVNNNNAAVNGPTSLIPLAAAGIYIDGNGNRVNGNTANGNILTGIQVALGAGGNQIFNNPSAVGNPTDLEDDNPACGTDTWSDNVFFVAVPAACIH